MLRTKKDSNFIKSDDLLIQLYNEYTDLIEKENLKGKLFIAENYAILKLNSEIHAFKCIKEIKNYLKNGESKRIYQTNICNLKNFRINREMDCIFGFVKDEFIKITKNGEKIKLKEFSEKPLVCYKTSKLYFIEERSLKYLDYKTNEEIVHIKDIKYNEKDINCFDFEEDILILALKSNKIIFREKEFHFHSSLIQFIKKDGNSIVSVSNKMYITTGENSLSIPLVNNNIKYKIYDCLITEKNIIVNSNKGIFNYSKEEGLLI